MPRHCFLTSPGGRSSGGRCTSVTAISAPCTASLSAVARPMPFIPPAPVIRATLLSSPAMHYLLCLLPPPATASAEGAQLNGRPFPATASAEGAQLNVPPFPATASAEGAQLNAPPFPAGEGGGEGLYP